MFNVNKFKRALISASLISIELERLNNTCSAIITFHTETHAIGKSFIVPATISDDQIVFAQAFSSVQDNNGTFIKNLSNSLHGNKHCGLTVDFIRDKEKHSDCGIDCFRFNTIEDTSSGLKISSQLDFNVFYSPERLRSIRAYMDLPSHLKLKFSKYYNSNYNLEAV